jgi:LmbE family N-acetylglucosaminyl deacetylase
MLIAPHPDDEALACSITLQRAVKCGASIRVIYATDGDDNPWPQRMLERKWRINSADRKRWGTLRRAEAMAALRVLGVDASDAQFVALPDQGLTKLLQTDCRSAVERFVTIIRGWSPTDLLLPSVSDTHPDHNALAVIMRLVLAEFSEGRFSAWYYAVHGRSLAFFGRAQAFAQSQAEEETKLKAILCHKTQIKLSRKRFLGYASRPERILELGKYETTPAHGGVRAVRKQGKTLHVKLRLAPKLVRTGDTALFLLGRDAKGAVHCLRSNLPSRSCKVDMANCSADLRITAHYRGNTFAGDFTIPVHLFSPAHSLFVKLERRSLFFDEAGWLEVSPTVPARETGSLVAPETSFAIR